MMLAQCAVSKSQLFFVPVGQGPRTVSTHTGQPDLEDKPILVSEGQCFRLKRIQGPPVEPPGVPLLPSTQSSPSTVQTASLRL